MSLTKIREGINSSPVLNVTNTDKDLSNTLQSLDWQTFSRRKKELFEYIEKIKNNVSRQDLLLIIERLREHNIEDGYMFAQNFQCTAQEYLKILNNPRFMLKHPKRVNSFISRLEQKSDNIKNIENYTKTKDNFKYLETQLEKKANQFRDIDNFFSYSPMDPVTTKVMSELDDVYSIVLTQKQFSLDGKTIKGSRGDYLGGQYLQKVSNLGKYDQLKVIDTLYMKITHKKDSDVSYSDKLKSIVNLLKQRGLNDTDINQFQTNHFLEKGLVEEMVMALDINPQTIDFKNIQYKPLGLTFFTENALAEKYNKEELITMLDSHYGNKAKLNHVGESYAIEFDKNKEINREKIIDIRKYKNIRATEFIDGKMIFQALKENDKRVVVYDGKEQKGEYNSIHDHYIIADGEICFIGCDDFHKDAVLVVGGKEGQRFSTIYTHSVVFHKGVVSYLAKRDGKTIVVHGNEEIDEFIDATSPEIFDDKLVFTAQQENGKWIALEDYKRVGKEYDKKIEVLDYINGKSLVGIGTNLMGNGYVEYDGKKDSKYGEKLLEYSILDGKPLLRVESSKIGGNSFFVYGGKEYGEYYNLHSPMIVDNKFSFIGEEHPNSGSVFVEEDKILVRASWIGSVGQFENKIFFSAKVGDKDIVWYDGRATKGYTDINTRTEGIVIYNGIPHFLAKREDSRRVLANTNGEEFQDFQWSDNLRIIADSIYFVAFGDDQKASIIKNNKVLIDGCDTIYTLEPYLNGVFYCYKKDRKVIYHREGEAGEFEMTNQEQQKLEMLNLCTNLRSKPDTLPIFQEQVKSYLDQKATQDEAYPISKTIVNSLANTIRQTPKVFLDTVSPDKERNIKQVQKKIIEHIFPELIETPNFKVSTDCGPNGVATQNNSFSQNQNVEDYLEDNNSESLDGGDPEGIEGLGKNKEILILKDQIDEIIITNILGQVDADTGKRSRVEFPIAMSSGGIQKETTITLPNVKPGTIILPKPIGSTIIPQRIKSIEIEKKWFKKYKVEKKLNITKKSLGLDSVCITDKTKQIVYSLQIPFLRLPIDDINVLRYSQFKDQFEKNWGAKNKDGEHKTSMLDSILEFDTETNLFIASIGALPIKEQLTQIEQYVRKYAYYDIKNKEVNDSKIGKSNQERLFICEQRLIELKKSKIDLDDNLSTKKRAGVCADFALITTGILRKAGIISGIMKGFSPSSKIVTLNDAHACSFAVLPSKSLENQIVILDGTPRGASVEAFPSIEEQEKAQIIKEQQIEKETIESLQKIETIMERGQDNYSQIKGEIESMYNGNLENAMNTILYDQVDIIHYQTISNILNAYWYSSIAQKDINAQKEEILNFLISQKNTKNSDVFKPHEAGSKLFSMVQSFLKRFDVGQTSGFDVIDIIIDGLHSQLSTVEYMATKLIIQYLKAEKMVK